MYRFVGGGFLVFLICLNGGVRAQSVGVSSAQAPAFDPWDRTFALTGQIGFGTPVGYFGADADYTVASPLALYAGTGIGRGVQLAGGLRVRPLQGNVTAFGIGAGFSLGHSDLVDPSIAHPESRLVYEYRPGYFANLDVFIEHRWSSHFVMRESLGYAKVLNAHPDSVCPESSTCRSGAASKGLPGTLYIGMAFGYVW